VDRARSPAKNYYAMGRLYSLLVTGRVNTTLCCGTKMICTSCCDIFTTKLENFCWLQNYLLKIDAIKCRVCPSC